MQSLGICIVLTLCGVRVWGHWHGHTGFPLAGCHFQASLLTSRNRRSLRRRAWRGSGARCSSCSTGEQASCQVDHGCAAACTLQLPRRRRSDRGGRAAPLSGGSALCWRAVQLHEHRDAGRRALPVSRQQQCAHRGAGAGIAVRRYVTQTHPAAYLASLCHLSPSVHTWILRSTMQCTMALGTVCVIWLQVSHTYPRTIPSCCSRVRELTAHRITETLVGNSGKFAEV